MIHVVALISLACWLGALSVGWWAATIGSGRWQRKTRTTGASRARVLMVRPCAGAEPDLYRNLVSLDGAVTQHELRVRFAVATAADPAWEVARRAARALSNQGIDATAIVTGGGGPNRKVAQLASIVEREPKAEVILCVDSDVCLREFELDGLVDPLLTDSMLGAIWAPPSEHGVIEGLGDRASRAVLAGSLHAFPLLCGVDPTGLVGKTWGIRSTSLDAIGGFGSLIDFLGEDIEMARRLLALGLKIEPSAQITRSRASGRSFQATVERYARWMTVVRTQRAALMLTYPLFFFGASLLIALGTMLATVAVGWVGVGGALIALSALAIRVGLALVARSRSALPTDLLNAVIDAVLGDLVLALAFLRACRTREFTWRGVPLEIQSDGKLVYRD